MKIVAIVNPLAGKGRGTQAWPRLLEASGKAARITTWWTERPGHAEALAAQARREGYDRVVAVGGDGTIFEVVNGLWWEPQGRLPSLATVPFGTGCDYVRNFELGSGLGENLATALGEATVPVNVGICRLPGLDGQPRQLVFVNILGLGFDARVVHRFRRRRSRLRGKIDYLTCGLQELLRLKSHRLEGEIDGLALEAKVIIFVVGLGRCFGGGIAITPYASPQSDNFQLVWAQPLSPITVLGLLPDFWAGQHLNHPKIHTGYAAHLKVRTTPPALVEAEGELVGRTPISVELHRRGLLFAAGGLKNG